MAARAALAAGLLAAAASGADANELFKCGTTFQDRPCDGSAVQQRFSRTQGRFSIEQVNPTTDKDCAQAARSTMAWWNRMSAGESLEQLNAEIQAQHTSRYEKSRQRDVLTALRGYRGNPIEVRSQLESQCMAYKRRHGWPTEREFAAGAAALAGDSAPASPADARGYAGSDAEARRAEVRSEAAARRAAADARAAAARAGRWP